MRYLLFKSCIYNDEIPEIRSKYSESYLKKNTKKLKILTDDFWVFLQKLFIKEFIQES